MHEHQFRVSDLVRALHAAVPAPAIGRRVRLNSGSPEMLVVDFVYGGGMVTAAYPGGEITVPAPCLQRI